MSLYRQQIEYQKAERFVKRIQDMKKEVEGKNKIETYVHLVEEGHRIQESGYCPKQNNA